MRWQYLEKKKKKKMRQRIALKIGKRTDHKYHTSKQFVLTILERLSNLINDTDRLILEFVWKIGRVILKIRFLEINWKVNRWQILYNLEKFISLMFRQWNKIIISIVRFIDIRFFRIIIVSDIWKPVSGIILQRYCYFYRNGGS